MKFSHSLLFSTVPEWQSYYVSYDSLKATIYKLEKELASKHQSTLRLSNQASTHQSGFDPTQSNSTNNESRDNSESVGLLDNPDGLPRHSTETCDEPQSGDRSLTPSDRTFLQLLSQELSKVDKFYQSKEKELLDELNSLVSEIGSIEKEGFNLIQHNLNQPRQSTEQASDDDDDDDDDDNDRDGGREDASPSASKPSTHPRRFSLSTQRQQLLKSAKIFGILPILSFSSKPVETRRSRSLSRPLQSPSKTNAPRPPPQLMDHSTTDSTLNHASPSHPLVSNDTSLSTPSQDLKNLLHSTGTSKPSLVLQRKLMGPSEAPRSLSVGSPAAQGRPFETVSAEELSAFWMSNIEFIHDSRVFFKRRITQLFVNLNSLKTYIDLNFTAFRKILKKYDKVFQTQLSSNFLEDRLLNQSRVFNPTTISLLQSQIDSLYPIYARLITHADEEMARKQLKAHLREQVVWERNTIWRDMIGLERKGWANSSNPVIDKPFARENTGGIDGNRPLTASPPKPLGFKQALKNLIDLRFWAKTLVNSSVLWCLVATCGFILSMKYSTFESEPERNCLAMLVFVVVLWTSEALPLFVTGMFVPLLVIVLRVIRDKANNNQRMDSTHAAMFVFGQMFNPTIVLLLGAFTIAAVLSKHNIDKVMAAKLLSLAGSKPRAVLLAYMSVTCFASMWISNVAAPVLSYSLAQPILRTIPTRSPFTRSLILGIALAADIGGQASPIASPQNLIAISYMNPPPSWIVWFSIGIPISALTIISTWGILTWSYERNFNYSKENVDLEEDPALRHLAPQSKFNEPIVYIKPIPNPKESFSFSQWFILFVSLVTILLWCFENLFHGFFGDMGVIALIPMIIFFGSGLLRKSDFDNFPWSIVFLAMSGIGLGKSVLSSGLLNDMDIVIESVLKGLTLWPITIIFGFLVLMISTFISHTVASVLLIPIAFQIGNSMDANHSRLLIFITTFICSNGMGLPVSSFPNQTAVNLEDEFGIRYLSSKDFLKFGLLSSFLGFLIISTFGFSILFLFGY